MSPYELSQDRKGFIIKTYTIIFIMLAVTSTITSIVYTQKDVKVWAI